MDTEKQRQRRCDDARLTESGNTSFSWYLQTRYPTENGCQESSWVDWSVQVPAKCLQLNSKQQHNNKSDISYLKTSLSIKFLSVAITQSEIQSWILLNFNLLCAYDTTNSWHGQIQIGVTVIMNLLGALLRRQMCSTGLKCHVMRS